MENLRENIYIKIKFSKDVKVLNENFGIVDGLMTTVHATTATQKPKAKRPLWPLMRHANGHTSSRNHANHGSRRTRSPVE